MFNMIVIVLVPPGCWLFTAMRLVVEMMTRGTPRQVSLFLSIVHHLQKSGPR